MLFSEKEAFLLILLLEGWAQLTAQNLSSKQDIEKTCIAFNSQKAYQNLRHLKFLFNEKQKNLKVAGACFV